DPPGSQTSKDICQLKACGCAVSRAGMNINISNPPCAPRRPGRARPRPAVALQELDLDGGECGFDDEECEACMLEGATRSSGQGTNGDTCDVCHTLFANPCASDGSDCQSGPDCCSGFCSDDSEYGPPGTCQPSEDSQAFLDPGEACDPGCSGTDSCSEGT